jgi:hypothetical protein
MKTNQGFCYEPDKPAEYLVCEFDIDDGFDIDDVGSNGGMISDWRGKLRGLCLSSSLVTADKKPACRK